METVESEELSGLVVEIVQECKKILREPEKSQAQHAVKVLAAFVDTTRQSSGSNIRPSNHY
jgi:DNA repair/transcription protein MET18/MMS19